MRKYVYDNAIVYITEPTEKQKDNIRKATERFVVALAKKGMIGNEQRRNNLGVSRINIDARKRD